MVNISERNNQQNELASMGYSLKYIDEWATRLLCIDISPAIIRTA
jgi:hypothetical protein